MGKTSLKERSVPALEDTYVIKADVVWEKSTLLRNPVWAQNLEKVSLRQANCSHIRWSILVRNYHCTGCGKSCSKKCNLVTLKKKSTKLNLTSRRFSHDCLWQRSSNCGARTPGGAWMGSQGGAKASACKWRWPGSVTMFICCISRLSSFTWGWRSVSVLLGARLGSVWSLISGTPEFHRSLKTICSTYLCKLVTEA